MTTVTGNVEQWLGGGGAPDTVPGFHGISYLAVWTPSTAITIAGGNVAFGSLPNSPSYDVTLYDTDNYADGSGGALIPNGMAGLYLSTIHVVGENGSGWIVWDNVTADAIGPEMILPANYRGSHADVIACQEGATFNMIAAPGDDVHFIKWTLTYFSAFPASYVGPLT